MERHGCIARVLWVAFFHATFVVATGAAANPAADFAAAADHYRLQRWELARNQFQLFLQSHPNHTNAADALFFLAETESQLGQHAAARQTYRQWLAQADRQGGSGPPDRAESASLAARRARAEFRIAEIDYLNHSDVDADQRLSRFVRTFPRDRLCAYALPYLGDLAWQHERYDDALAYYRKAMQDFPTGPLADKCVCHSGMLLYLKGDIPQAETSLRNFVQQHRQSSLAPIANYWLGRTELALGKYAAAGHRLRALYEQESVDPHRTACGFYAGQAFRLAGDTEMADQLLRAIETGPQGEFSDDASYERLLIASDSGMEVEQLLERRANYQTRFPSGEHLAAIDRLIARAMLQEHQYRHAIPILEQLVAQPADGSPDIADTDRYLLSWALSGAGEYDRALRVLDEHLGAWDLALEPGILVTRACSLLGMGDLSGGIAELEEYVRRYPTGPDILTVQEDLQRAKLRRDAALSANLPPDPITPAGEAPANQSPTVGTGIQNGGQTDFRDVALVLEQAELAYGNRAYPTAARLYQQVVDRGPNTEYRQRARSGLAWIALREQRFVDAERAFTTLLNDQLPRDLKIEVHEALAETYHHLDRNTDEADQYVALLQLEPNGTRTSARRLQLARLHEAAKRYEQATEQLRRLLRDDPTGPDVPAAHYLWAWIEQNQGAAHESARRFAELAESYPNSEYADEALYRVADYAASKKKYQDAFELLDKLLREGRDEKILPYARYLQSQMLAGLQRWSEIPLVLDPLIDTLPSHPLHTAARYWRAEAWYRQKMWQESEREFTALLSETKGNTAGWVPMIPLRLAQLVAEKKQWQDALTMANAIESTYPNFSQQFEVDYLRGRALVQLARLREARQMFERTIDAPAAKGTETEAMAHWMIGETYYHGQQFREALSAYQQAAAAIALPRWRAAALLGAGMSSEQLQQPQDAITYYQRLVEEFDVDPYLTEQATTRLRLLKGGAS